MLLLSIFLGQGVSSSPSRTPSTGASHALLRLVPVVFVHPHILEKRQVAHDLAANDGDVPRALEHAAVPDPGGDGDKGGPGRDAQRQAGPPQQQAADPVEDDEDGGEDEQRGDDADEALVLGHDVEQALEQRLQDRVRGVEQALGLDDGVALEHLEGRVRVEEVGVDGVDELGREEG